MAAAALDSATAQAKVLVVSFAWVLIQHSEIVSFSIRIEAGLAAPSLILNLALDSSNFAYFTVW